MIGTLLKGVVSLTPPLSICPIRTYDFVKAGPPLEIPHYEPEPKELWGTCSVPTTGEMHGWPYLPSLGNTEA